MALLTFIAANWDSIVVAIALIIGIMTIILVNVKKGETKILEDLAYGFVTQAEQQLGDGTGKLKYAIVADWLYQRVPASLKLIFSATDIQNIIEKILPLAQETWEKNKKLLLVGKDTTVKTDAAKSNTNGGGE